MFTLQVSNCHSRTVRDRELSDGRTWQKDDHLSNTQVKWSDIWSLSNIYRTLRARGQRFSGLMGQTSGQDLTWPVCDQTVSTLCLHLDVCAAARFQRQHMWSVRGLVDLFPETSALQRTGNQTAAGERAGCRPRDVAQRRHGTPGNRDFSFQENDTE